MASPDRLPSSGPAESRLVRTLLYLGDGTMAGAVVYFLVAQVLFALSGLGPWMVAALVVLLGIGTVRGLAWASAVRKHRGRSDSAQSRLSEEWRETRRWPWVAVVAIPVAAGLVGATVSRWGWTFGWFLPESDLLGVGTLVLGLALRILVRLAVTKEGGSVFLPGTRRGLAGFLALLLGAVVVLAWGGVRYDVLVLVVFGIGGYGLLYLLAAAGVD